jgi:predicted metal-binding protein
LARKVAATVPNEVLQKDLENYRDMAIGLGASDARIINADIIKVDDRAQAKCSIPKCSNYGTSLNCPPYVPSTKYWKKLISKYKYATVFRIKVPVQELLDERTASISRVKVLEIISKVESKAFYDGYYFALGLGAGPCRLALCAGERCAALVTPGSACKHALRSRPSMEAAGIDVYSLATSLGWDIYPIGRGLPQPFPPCGNRVGLVLIT